MRPPGKHSCVVCLGTACYIKGGMNLLDAVSEAYEVEPGKTTDNGELSLLTARCIGSCGLAPAVVLDSAVTPKQTPQELLQKIERLTDGS
jgi:bidirectional [NiFe] hydrogenase diaphorase subunit